MTGLELTGRLIDASNATFTGVLDGRQVVYKPVAGEKPLWDFPDGTLYLRERAAYVVSRALGWDVVPETWIAGGPHGPGMLQAWVEVDPGAAPVDLVAPGQVPAGFRAVLEARDQTGRPVVLVHEDTPALRRMALFDVLVNNADRKGGHVLAAGDRRHGVDHGVCFHVEPKLRTVLWGWIGEPLTDDERADIARVLQHEETLELLDGLSEAEREAFLARGRALLDAGVFPAPSGEWPAIPWPAF